MKYKTILWPLMSKRGRDTWDALAVTEDWQINHYTVEHKASRYELWVGNGFWFFNPYRPNETKAFNIFDKYACHSKAKLVGDKSLPWSKP